MAPRVATTKLRGKDRIWVPSKQQQVLVRARHQDLEFKAPAVVAPRPDVESDVRYRRVDSSQQFAYTARWRFAHNIARGEAGMRLAEAALLVAAEDDAIASHSTVAFPVESYLARIQKLADEFDLQRLQPMRLAARAASVGASSSNSSCQALHASALSSDAVVAELEDYLFVGQRISVPPFGRSNLPPNALLDHPGVWEDARWAYLNELLVRRKGHPAAVAILLSEVLRRLLSRGSLDFAASIDTRGFVGLPKTVVLPGITRDLLLDRSVMQTPQPSPAPELHKPAQRTAAAAAAAPAAAAPAAAGSGAEAEQQGQDSGGRRQAGGQGGEAQEHVLQEQQQGTSSSSASSSSASSGSASSSSASSSSGSSSSSSRGAGLTWDDGLLALNTCTSDALAELLRFQKRAYWPLPWDTNVDAYDGGGVGSHGGFKAAAKAATGDEMSAQLRAVSTVASWRLERGVWTSPGAGDVRRCRAACERLVLLGGDGADEERRDLAVILLHAGELAAARAELAAYMDTQHFRAEADGMDRVLCKKMMLMLREVKSLESVSALSLEGTLAGPSPEEVKFDERRLPLTW